MRQTPKEPGQAWVTAAHPRPTPSFPGGTPPPPSTPGTTAFLPGQGNAGCVTIYRGRSPISLPSEPVTGLGWACGPVTAKETQGKAAGAPLRERELPEEGANREKAAARLFPPRGGPVAGPVLAGGTPSGRHRPASSPGGRAGTDRERVRIAQDAVPRPKPHGGRHLPAAGWVKIALLLAETPVHSVSQLAAPYLRSHRVPLGWGRGADPVPLQRPSPRVAPAGQVGYHRMPRAAATLRSKGHRGHPGR